ATDNCAGAVTVTHADATTSGSCINRFVVKRTYTATDVCGNSSSQTQTITVDDETAPVVSNAAGSLDRMVQCTGDVPAPDDSQIHASDNCGGAPVISHDADQISDQTCA